MSPRARLLHSTISIWLVVLVAMAGCSDGENDSESRSFDPARYDSSCTVDADCVLVTRIDDCSSCCGRSAVRAASAAEDYDEVTKACSTMTLCTMQCEEVTVRCLNDQCTVQVIASDGGMETPPISRASSDRPGG